MNIQFRLCYKYTEPGMVYRGRWRQYKPTTFDDALRRTLNRLVGEFWFEFREVKSRFNEKGRPWNTSG